MNRGFLCLASAAALFCLTPHQDLAETPAGLIARAAIVSTNQGSPDVAEQEAAGTNYYVDCGDGETDGDGRSPVKPWHTLETVNGHSFLPGDAIYLKRGTECHGLLWPKGSGSPKAVIHLSAYGQGARPKVIAANNDEEAFKLFDQEYWDVDSIEFSGGTIFGVFVSGQTGVLHHIHVRNLLVHDVHGSEVKSKESGLVVISPGKLGQRFDDVLVEGVTAYDTNQWSGILVGGGNFGEVPEKDWCSHVIVRNSTVHDLYGDGIILFRVKDGLIDSSAAWHTGMQPTQTIGTPNAIWTWMCTDCVVRRSEAFLTDSPGVDGGAFDIDWGNTRNSVLDSYGHDTQGYCIAVFGAGYVTHDSLVRGNLCINNARSPRMASYQGAIFLWTWNNGVIENLRVEKNTIYWTPPGSFPAVLNHGDIRGSQNVFRENQIYSDSPWVIDSNNKMSFQDNRYTTCGEDAATWVFDGHPYKTFDQYRNGSGQEHGSAWKSEMGAAPCVGSQQPLELGSKSGISNTKNVRKTDRSTAPGWTIVSEIPASMDGAGLFDSAAAGQLTILKNLYMQFRASGLKMRITLNLKQSNSPESLQNAIGDLGLEGIKTSRSPAHKSPDQAMTRLVAPDGTSVREWLDFVGPTETGLAVRRFLGEPLYSRMESELQ
jgi:Right handed beta helix region